MEPDDSSSGYWNHNTAFHREILRRCATTSGRALDVGCGDGLLLSRLASTGRPVMGIEPDATAAALARQRCADLDHVTVLESTFDDVELTASSFGFVTLVATLHHMPAAQALERCARLLQPGGRLYVLALTRLASRTDLAVAYAAIPRARIVGALRHESWPAGVPVTDPAQTFSELRDEAREALPGATIRRRPYYRCSLEWQKP